MSFIGTLEQFSLSTILLKIEGEAKNGVLIIKQEAQWVELSFHQGQLMCIGPVRSNKTLGDRLLQAGVISQRALQEVTSTPGASLQNETRTVISLIDLGYLAPFGMGMLLGECEGAAVPRKTRLTPSSSS